MEYTVFLEQVRQAVQERSAQGARVKITRIARNNQSFAEGLIITGGGGNAAPVIYLDEFYWQYQEGTTLERIVEQILDLHRRYRPAETIDMSFYRDFEQVKGRILCRLINCGQNRPALKCMPHRPFFDLAVVYYYKLEDDILGGGSILIQNAHLEEWGISPETLHRTALLNTLQMMPYELFGLEEMMREFFEDGYASGEDTPVCFGDEGMRSAGGDKEEEDRRTYPVDRDRETEDEKAYPAGRDSETESGKMFPADRKTKAEDKKVQPAGRDMETGDKKVQPETEFGKTHLQMYVLTNTERRYGAVNLLYPEILKAAAGRLNGDFYVLPSSVHECMLVPVSTGAVATDLQQMVREINQACVAPEEVLGDSIYCYERETGKLYLAA